MHVSELIGPFLALGFLLFLYWIAIHGPLAGSKKARLQIHSVSGENAGLVLATLSIARLVFDLGLRTQSVSGLGTVVAVGFAAVLALLMARSIAVPLIGALGLLSFLAIVFLEEGPTIGFWFIVVALGLLIFMLIIRPLSV